MTRISTCARGRAFRLGAGVLLTAFLAGAFPAGAQLDISYIDRPISKSKTFEFDYYGNYDYLKNITDTKGSSNWNNKLVFNRTIENVYSGNWQKVNFELARNKSKGGKTQVTRLDSKIGGKKYLGNSGYFIFGVFEGYQSGTYPAPKSVKGDIFRGQGVYSFFTAGGGGGRVFDIANDIRARKALGLLSQRGYMKGEPSEELFGKITELLRQKKESTQRTRELNALLAQADLLAKEAFDTDTVFALSRLLDGSSDTLEKGLEWRAGLGHEISKENSDQDRLNLIGGRIHYGKPFTDRLGVAETVDFLHGMGENGSGNNVRSIAKIAYSMVKTEVSLTWRLTADMRSYEAKTDSVTRDYDYESWFNEFALQYSYEIYNKVNLSAVMKFNRKDYHNDYDTTSRKHGWNREFHAMVNYEIF